MYNNDGRTKIRRNYKVESVINKIVVVEGLDKTGKSTFVNVMESVYLDKFKTSNNLTKFSFPNRTTPIGKSIRDELDKEHPDSNVISSPNFLAEMVHYWMREIFNHDFKNNTGDKKNYIFDRYFISTMAYQAFYNESVADLNFIKLAIKNNSFLKVPTDLIMLDLPNSIIIERTLKDEKNNLVDAHDTKEINVLDKIRRANQQTVGWLEELVVKIHWFCVVCVYDTNELAKELVGNIF
jgi:thymidylate kinase